MRIRMKTCGTKIKPMFDIFVARGPTRRRVPVTEYIGKYCILRDQDGYMQLDLNIERAKHWIAEGAIPSNGAREVLEKVGLVLIIFFIITKLGLHTSLTRYLAP
ncbi:hypothetical protein BJ085DRAFT_20260 [Dimargaris cristalligena]|uniref:30S ribosomal protein S16 n=1 Tax=Dimargaris cristalligena TaxID=215637 RepID=A0A4Q0A0S9_9FUNG|nr:hypothetical protein BJ085DRAFT_20260 [Dimargaris cristalligena]|eukprot:RKP39655.1 hypothetical protein BJ085DRAFT_20260 [Dimargaris cristalligena]